MKENRQGCLSRSIKAFFKLLQSLKNVGSLSKRLFDKLKNVPVIRVGHRDRFLLTRMDQPTPASVSDVKRFPVREDV